MGTPDAFPQIDGYTITARLGAGASGTVYLAQQLALSREVALKVLSGASASSLPRFHREAAAMARLSHAGLVRLYDHGVAGGAPYIAMEYLPGGSLADRIASGKARGVSAALRIARELLEVLAVMHEAGLLHRDIKPSNVLMREAGAAVLADLGLVRQDDPSLTRITRDGMVLGTVSYLAPEVYRTHELTRATDLFALGVVLHEVLTGQPAAKLGQFAPEYRAPDPAEAVPECPEALRAVVMEMLAPDPAARPESAVAAHRRLRDVRSRRVRTSSAQTPVPGRERASWAWMLTLGGCALGLAVGVAARMAPWRTAEPVLALRASSTEVAVDLAPHEAELSVSVFDAAGRPAASRIAPAGGAGSVVIGGLRPGARYTVSVFRPGAQVLARREFATAAQVRVHGLEPGPAPVLWMSANPTMTFSDGKAEVELGAAPRAVALRARGPFRVALAGQAPVALELKLPPPEERQDARLGLCVEARRDLLVREGGGAVPLPEWLERHDIRHVSLMPGAKGWPVLDPALLAGFSRAGRVALVARVHPGAAQAPGESGWERGLEDPALSKIAPFALGVRFDWMLESFGASTATRSRTGMTELQARWAPHLTARHPGVRMVRSVQLRDMMSALVRRGPGFAPAEIEEANAPIDGDLLRPWLEWMPEAVAKYRAGRLDSWVRAVTVDYEREDASSDSDGERAMMSVVRQFLLVRRFFPGAAVVFDLWPRLMKRDGTLRPCFAGLEDMARRLAGADTVTTLASQPALAPSLAIEERALAAAFRAGARGIQVFFTDARPADATFRPARAGLLRTAIPPSCVAGAPRFLEGGRPVPLRVTSAPAIFEELVPVVATSADGAAVAVSP